MMSSASEIEDETFECANQDNEPPSSDFSQSEDDADRIKADSDNMEIVITTEKKSRLFTAAQISVLKKYYITGIRGTGERCLPLIANAEKETGLTTDQIKVIISWL